MAQLVAYSERCSITSGPSKFDLMVGLFSNKEASVALKFTLKGIDSQVDTKDIRELSLKIHSVARVDDDQFAIECSHYLASADNPVLNITGYYSTRTRTGYVTLETWL